MTTALVPVFEFDNSYVRELEGLYAPSQAAQVPAPRVLLLNSSLCAELGIDAAALGGDYGAAVLSGNEVPTGSSPVAQAYSGHQFGGFSPRLGDGRALLLGELLDTAGRRRDLHLKGSGRTPFSRGGDGKAAVGPVLREYLMGEAMHALGIPTTRALAAVATGESIRREGMLPGAVLSRVAASHLRVGTFQFAAAHGDAATVRRLADYSIARHYPEAAEASNRYLALLEAVADAQALLIAKWMLVGFIHGVMNTDNMTISGETIDYGPCALMDRFDPATVFSSIDGGGRYAYGNQPRIGQWNLARLAETLLPLIDGDTEIAIAKATEVLQGYTRSYSGYWLDGMRAKLGLVEAAADDETMANDLLDWLESSRHDYTTSFRSLPERLTGVVAPELAAWRARLAGEGRDPAVVAADMNRVNPIYIPRNHLVEAALAAAVEHDDLAPTRLLLEVLAKPFNERPGFDAYAEPAPASFGVYQTFCGT